MKRVSVKELKSILDTMPDDAIICCQSDAEGNEMSTLLEVNVGTVGKVYNYSGFTYTEGEDIEGVDMEADKGKRILFLVPCR